MATEIGKNITCDHSLESSEGRFLGQCHFAKKSAPVIGNGLQ
jgi:hypothetical protein